MRRSAWRCTMLSLLVLGAFVTANLAGCGGGGGGGGVNSNDIKNVRLTIRALSVAGAPIVGSIITLTNNTSGASRASTPTNAAGEALFASLPTGSYRVVVANSGQAASTIVVARTGTGDTTQTIVVVPGFDGGNPQPGGLGARGVLIDARLNGGSAGSCGTTTFLGQVVIRVRDVSNLNDPNPIIVTTIVRSRQSVADTPVAERGRFFVGVPRPGTYRVFISQGPADANGPAEDVSARSATFNVAAGQVADIGTVCVNTPRVNPGAPTSTPAPTATSGPTATPDPNSPTATPTTGSPTATPTTNGPVTP